MRIVFLAIVLGLAAKGQELRLGKANLIPERQAKELLRAMCPGAIEASKDEFHAGQWGCASCPEFTDLKVGTFDLAAVHYGHFSGAGADEASLAMVGCTSHVNQFGGTVLLTRSGGHWKRAGVELGRITSRCISVKRKDGRDLLVCESEDMHQGIGDLMLYSVDLAPQKSPARETSLLHLNDNMATCGENLGATTMKVDPLQSASYRRVHLDDGKLRVEVVYGWRPAYSAENMKACRAAQEKDKPIPALLKPPTKIYTIEFDFDGVKFAVSAASKQAKATVETFHVDR
jgi:hypothetical protein